MTNELDSEVEYQLDQAEAAVKVGAYPWLVDPQALANLRDQCRSGFEKAKQNWTDAKSKVLRQAKYTGTIAALISELDHNSDDDPGYPDWISDTNLCLAAVITRLACPPPSVRGQSPIGIRCYAVRCGRRELEALGVRVSALLKDILAEQE